MAIKSKIDLPNPIIGVGKLWSATLENKVGTRSGMKCIYKILKNGESKRAGVYYNRIDYDVIRLNIAGDEVAYHRVSKEIAVEAGSKYAPLETDPHFREVVERTLAHFGAINHDFSPFTPPPKIDMTISAEEAAAIPEFGVF